MPSPVTAPKMLVDAYQRHHWELAMASADVNGVAGKSWATNKSASARSTREYPGCHLYFRREGGGIYNLIKLGGTTMDQCR